jgi:cytochrome P450
MFRNNTPTSPFHPNATTFNPSRWLDAPPSKLKEMDRSYDLAFGAGRSTCLGRDIAEMELRKVFVEILRRFDLGLVDPVRTMGVCTCHQLWVQRGMWVRARAVERREVLG